MSVKRIVLCQGSHAVISGASIFFKHNRKLLAEKSVDIVKTKQLIAPEQCAELAKQLPGETAICVLPQRFCTPEAFIPLAASLREYFPGAELAGILCMLRQDYELDGGYNFNVFKKGYRQHGEWLIKRAATLNNYHSIASMLQKNLRGNVTLLPMAHFETGFAAYQGEILKVIGLSIPDFVAAGGEFVLPHYNLCAIPRELLAFYRACHAITPEWAMRVPWFGQLKNFTARSGYEGDFSSSFSPEERGAVVARYAAGNARLADELGLPGLFPEFEPEQNWQHFDGLTPEVALKVAKQLDTDFAAAGREEMDALPAHYFSREQTIVHQALREACGVVPRKPAMRNRPEAKLSVVTLSYNQADFIAQNIESVFAQKTDFPIQHIISDDNSTDGTQEIILDYAARHAHIIPILHKQRSFAAQGIRDAFDMARTKYVALCDGDDYFSDPEKLQIQADFLDANPSCALCFHIAHVVFENDKTKERFYPRLEDLPRGMHQFYYLSDLIKGNFMQTNSVMYRWRFAQDVPGWLRTDLQQSDWYWHLLHAEQGKIGFINKVMSVYRRHQNGVYWLAETNRLAHRARVGKSEIAMYQALINHFGQKYEAVFLDLINGVFADCLLFDSNQQETETGQTALNKLCEAYPDFARHFLASLNMSNKQRPIK